MYQIVQRKMTQPPTSRTTSVKVSPVIFLEPSDVTIGLVDFKDKRTAGHFARYGSRNFTQNLRRHMAREGKPSFGGGGRPLSQIAKRTHRCARRGASARAIQICIADLLGTE